MAYAIKVIRGQQMTAQAIIAALNEHFADTRFRVVFNTQAKRKSNRPESVRRFFYDHIIWVTTIRLKTKKDYCGSHPGACQRPHVADHRRTTHLEGADYVEFNDRINDVLDAQGLWADVSSAACIVRMANCRRISYEMTDLVPGQNSEWTYVGDPTSDYLCCFDNVGEAPPSRFPLYTPGIYHTKQKQYACEG